MMIFDKIPRFWKISFFHFSNAYARFCILAVALIGGIFLFHSCEKNKMNRQEVPSSFKTLTIYNLINASSEDMEDKATLEKIPHITLEEDITRRIFSNVRYHWKIKVKLGYWVAMAKMKNGDEIPIKVFMQHGRMFEVPGQWGYYTIEGDSRVLFEKVIKEIRKNNFTSISEEAINSWRKSEMDKYY